MEHTALINRAEASDEEFREDFPELITANHAIYAEFERQALLIASRRDKYSARTIAEFIRHNSHLSEIGSRFRLNNNRIPDLARLFIVMNPQHQGFFQTRESDMRLGLQS